MLVSEKDDRDQEAEREEGRRGADEAYRDELSHGDERPEGDQENGGDEQDEVAAVRGEIGVA